MRLITRSAIVSRSTILVFSLLLGTACTSNDAVGPEVSLIPAGTNQAALVSTDGKAAGGLSVTPKTLPEGGFAADIAVHVVNGRPSTTYTVQRAPEVGRVLGGDGSCQRALGLAPWSASDPVAAAFLSFVATGASDDPRRHPLRRHVSTARRFERAHERPSLLLLYGHRAVMRSNVHKTCASPSSRPGRSNTRRLRQTVKIWLAKYRFIHWCAADEACAHWSSAHFHHAAGEFIIGRQVRRNIVLS